MPSFLISIIELLMGIGLLFGGGELFVQGAVALAQILCIPQLVIGLTIVSLGTSAPELFVSLNSFLRGSDALAVSNVVGSNIFNVLVVLGSSALVLPLKVESRLIRRDVPLLLAVSAAVWGMASSGTITLQAGLALLLALLINTIWEIRTTREESQIKNKTNSDLIYKSSISDWLYAIIKLILGIALLTFGSNLLVTGASSIAKTMGISEAVIGLTIVSVGTSMPELITSLLAAIKGKTDLAIGNVVGSSLLNLLLVLSSCAIFSGSKGLQVADILIQKDFPIMVLTTLACMPIFWTKGQISRLEGGSLLAIYSLYLLDQVIPYTIPEFQYKFRAIVICFILPIAIIIITFKTINYWKSTKTI